MKKKQSLKAKKEFNEVLSSGKKIRSNLLLISYVKSKDFKIGISIPKKFGNAVIRNKNKRQLKEIISKINIYLYNYHIVVIVRKSWIDLSFDEKFNEFKKQILKINEK